MDNWQKQVVEEYRNRFYDIINHGGSSKQSLKEKIREKMVEREPDSLVEFMTGFAYIEERNKLYEGLIKTYSVRQTVNMLIKSNLVNRENIRVLDDTNKKTSRILLKTSNEKTNISHITKMMDTYGWVLGNSKEENTNEIKLWFNAKFDTSEIDNEYNQVYYHLVPYSKLNNILKNGLVPRAENKLSNLTDRVYLLKYDNPVIIEHLVSGLFRANKQPYKYKKSYCLLSVKVGQTNPHIRLFNDPHMDDAVYTLENIPPNLIEVIAQYDLDEKGNIIKFK